MPPLRIKICGLTRRQDAEAAARLGASYLGTVLVRSSPRYVEPEVARRLTEGLGVSGVAVVADRTPAEVAELARRAGSVIVQLHGDETPDTVSELRALGSWKVWKALRIEGRGDLERVLSSWVGVVDGLLLDGRSRAGLGGTGTRFRWEEVCPVLGEIRGRVAIVAAGGLTPENVVRAVSLLGPDVVDVSSGVETSPGRKDPALLRAFIRSASRLDAEAATP